MALDEEKIKRRLRELPREYAVWFAFRCALRVAPLLGDYRLENIWPQGDGQRHLCGIMHGLNASFGYARFVSIRENNAAVATATTTFVVAAAYAAEQDIIHLEGIFNNPPFASGPPPVSGELGWPDLWH